MTGGVFQSLSSRIPGSRKNSVFAKDKMVWRPLIKLEAPEEL